MLRPAGSSVLPLCMRNASRAFLMESRLMIMTMKMIMIMIIILIITIYPPAIMIIDIYIAQMPCEYGQMRVTNKYDTN